MHAKDQGLLTLGEAAAYLRVHRRTMSRLLQQGVVPGTKIGRQWRVRKADLDATVSGRAPGAPTADGSARGEVRGRDARVPSERHGS